MSTIAPPPPVMEFDDAYAIAIQVEGRVDTFTDLTTLFEVLNELEAAYIDVMSKHPDERVVKQVRQGQVLELHRHSPLEIVIDYAPYYLGIVYLFLKDYSAVKAGAAEFARDVRGFLDTVQEGVEPWKEPVATAIVEAVLAYVEIANDGGKALMDRLRAIRDKIKDKFQIDVRVEELST